MSPGPIRRIKPEEVGNFGIGDGNTLYWKDELVHTSATLKFSRTQTVLAIVVSIFTVLACVATVVQAWVSLETYLHASPASIAQPANSSVRVNPAPPANAR